MKNKFLKTFCFISLIFFFTSTSSKISSTQNFTEITDIINKTIQNNPQFKSSAYLNTAYLVDTFGPRLWGSQSLQDATEYMKNLLLSEGFENVRLEPNYNSTHWVRGNEQLIMLSPRKFPTKIPMVGLGKSIGGNVTSELIIFKSFEEAEKNSEKIFGKIVLFNQKWTNYGEVSIYRSNGASFASKYGAVACLVRSLTPVSIESPHGGAMNYNNLYPKIPAAAISIEDSDMFQRMENRGQKIILNLQMEAHFEDPVTTYNIIGEIKGWEFPSEILLLGGHIDSWDVGPQTGANDDAAGFMVCMEAVRVLLKLKLRPRRTIRFIAWAGEEFGDYASGAGSYARLHEEELEKHILAFESDEGTTDIKGWGYSGGEKGFEIFENLNKNFLVQKFGTEKVVLGDGVMQDTKPLYGKGIPVVRNLVEDTEDSKYYFSYHHSAGDTVNVLNQDDMDRNVAAIAAMFYIVADLPERLPRD